MQNWRRWTMDQQKPKSSEITQVKTDVAFKREPLVKGTDRKFTKGTEIYKLMKDAGVDFRKTQKALEKRNLFEIWIRHHTGKDLNEIKRLDSVIQVLDSDMSNRVMHKLEKGVPLGKDDLNLIRLLKETLEASHRLKFGEKRLNVDVKAQFQDIREAMFAKEKKNE